MGTLEREVVNRDVRCDMFMGGARARAVGRGSWEHGVVDTRW